MCSPFWPVCSALPDACHDAALQTGILACAPGALHVHGPSLHGRGLGRLSRGFGVYGLGVYSTCEKGACTAGFFARK